MMHFTTTLFSEGHRLDLGDDEKIKRATKELENAVTILAGEGFHVYRMQTILINDEGVVCWVESEVKGEGAWPS